MPHARNLCSTRLSKLQSCALLCLGVPPLLLLACILVGSVHMQWDFLSLWINKSDSMHVHVCTCTIWSEFASCGLCQSHDWWGAHQGPNSWEHVCLWPRKITCGSVSVWGHVHFDIFNFVYTQEQLLAPSMCLACKIYTAWHTSLDVRVWWRAFVSWSDKNTPNMYGVDIPFIPYNI